MSKYFTLPELLASSVAKAKGIQNFPSFEIVEHLKELAEFLDPLREEWGSGIRISSGFRNQLLNAAVGGVANSVHRIGYAVDLIPVNGKMKEFKKFVKNWIKDKDFDQCIIEKNSKGEEWVHIGLYNNSGQQRHNIFHLDVE